MNASKYRPEFAAALSRRVLQPGDAVLEIGAADGEHTRIYAERVGPTGSVVAVEPHRAHIVALRTLAATYPWVILRETAVGAVGGDGCLQVDRAHSKCSSLYRGNVGEPGDSYAVPVTTVDALVQSMPQCPAVIQVDAQGAEAAILRGATRVLSLPIVWVVELWRDGLATAGDSVDDVIEMFRAHAFAPSTVAGHACEWSDVSRVANARSGWSYCDFVMWPRDLVAA